MLDADWRWTRDEISRFVEEICKARLEDRPRYSAFKLRNAVWDVLEPLTRDPAPSYVVKDSEKDDPRLYDFLTMGINSSRGKAVEAALEYALWVGIQVQPQKKGADVLDGGFVSIPEVKEALEWQLENRSVEAASVIGARLQVLYWIDKPWLTDSVNRLFDLRQLEKNPAADTGWAAWNSFLVWVRPYIEYYKLLRDQFGYAVEQSSKVEVVHGGRHGPMHQLGEHLMLLYGRGELGLDEDGGLIKRFLKTAAHEVRAHAIWFVGNSLSGDDERKVPLPEGVLKRFMELWDWYWPEVGSREGDGDWQRYSFGSWFTSGQFPDDWSISRLGEFVKVVPVPEADHLIVDRLAGIARVDIRGATAVLDRMARTERGGIDVYLWSDSAKKILAMAMKDDSPVRDLAEKLINYLGLRGYLEFGELLKGF